jgi:hypothetical protein
MTALDKDDRKFILPLRASSECRRRERAGGRTIRETGDANHKLRSSASLPLFPPLYSTTPFENLLD